MDTAGAEQPAGKGAFEGRLSKVFELDRKGFNLTRGLVIFATLLVPLVVLGVIDKEQYWLSVSFGALFVGLSDPGGELGQRLAKLGSVALIGAFVTALAFGIGAKAWGWVVLATFAVTLVAGLAIRFGTNRFVAGLLLNTWFLIALGVAASYHHDGVATHSWNQALAWLVGSAAWAVVLGIVWLANGHKSPPKPVPEIPGDLSPKPLTRAIVAFSVLRALAVTVAVAIAWAFDLPNAYWMPLAALIAMKPTLEQSTLVAEQRLAGALIGSVLAAVFLLSIDSKHALEVLIVLFLALGTTIRMVNYAFYTALTAAGALVALNLPNPANLSAEGERVVYTLVGVGIGVLVMLLGGLLAKRTSNEPAQPAAA